VKRKTLLKLLYRISSNSIIQGWKKHWSAVTKTAQAEAFPPIIEVDTSLARLYPPYIFNENKFTVATPDACLNLLKPSCMFTKFIRCEGSKNACSYPVKKIPNWHTQGISR
jgi:hypothetical protein